MDGFVSSSKIERHDTQTQQTHENSIREKNPRHCITAADAKEDSNSLSVLHFFLG